MLLERMVAAAAAAPGNATNTVVIRGRKVSRREVQQEMRWWQWAYGDKKGFPPSVPTRYSVGDHKQELCPVQTIIQVWTGLDKTTS